MHNFVIRCEEDSSVGLLSINMCDYKFSRVEGLALISDDKLSSSE